MTMKGNVHGAPRCPECGSFRWFRMSEEMVTLKSPIVDDGKGSYKLGEEKVLGYTPGWENATDAWYECENEHSTNAGYEDPEWDDVEEWCREWF